MAGKHSEAFSISQTLIFPSGVSGDQNRAIKSVFSSNTLCLSWTDCFVCPKTANKKKKSVIAGLMTQDGIEMDKSLRESSVDFQSFISAGLLQILGFLSLSVFQIFICLSILSS